METVYHLKNDAATIRELQEGMQSKDTIVGLKNTHGIFGTNKWWTAIESGKLKLHCLKGSITHTWPGHQNDFPAFEVTDIEDKISKWPMERMPLQNNIGSSIEIDYVLQEYKAKSDLGSHTECIVEVRIER